MKQKTRNVVGIVGIAMTILAVNVGATCYVLTFKACPLTINIGVPGCTLSVGYTNYKWVKQNPTGKDDWVATAPQCRYDCADGVHFFYPGARPVGDDCGA